ncbi:MAG: hypothetical protein ACOCQX_04400 [Candidatus Nanoarchaeia archaeon]
MPDFARIEKNLEEISGIVEEYHKCSENLAGELIPLYNQINPALYSQKLAEAIKISANAHLTQKRYTKEPFLVHPCRTAYIAATLTKTQSTTYISLLHETLNGSQPAKSQWDIQNSFGRHTYMGIWGLSLLQKIPDENHKTYEIIEHFKEMYRINIMPAKICDVIDNLYTIRQMPGKRGMSAKKRQQEYLMMARKYILPMCHEFDKKHNKKITGYFTNLLKTNE